MKPSGHIFYEDEWAQKYEVQWETVGGAIDITTITQQPYVWGQPQEGFIRSGILYRKGIVTVHRQVIRVDADKYTIIAEGVSQFSDFIQMNFVCETGPTDPFIYHINHSIQDSVSIGVVGGPHWVDPSIPESETIWGDVGTDGILVESTGDDVLEWIDV